MAYYRIAQICEKGDLITDSADVFPDECQKHCTKCGSKTYTSCPACGEPIRGVTDNSPDYDGYQIPYYCHECGEPYPWTLRILDGAVEILSMDTEIDDTTRKIISSAIPDLITDSPQTVVAATKYVSYIGKASEITRNCLRALLFDVISEAAKRLIFG